MKETKKSVVSRFFSGKGFYMVLAGCLIAVGVAAWSAVDAVKNYTEAPSYSDEPQSYNSSETPKVEEPVQNEVSDQPYSEPEKPSDDSKPTDTSPVATYFVMPLSGNISKGYDSKTLQYSETFGDIRLHLGLDIEGEIGASIVACGDGIVDKIYNDAALGTVIEINHGNGLVAKYCGMDETVLVKEKQQVTPNQKLGTLGGVPNESADSTHLHFEMYKNGVIVSPLDTMDIK